MSQLIQSFQIVFLVVSEHASGWNAHNQDLFLTCEGNRHLWVQVAMVLHGAIVNHSYTLLNASCEDDRLGRIYPISNCSPRSKKSERLLPATFASHKVFTLDPEIG